MPNPPPIEYLTDIGEVMTCPKCDRIVGPCDRSEMIDGVKHHVVCPPPRTAKLLMMGHELPIVMRPDGRWELLPLAGYVQTTQRCDHVWVHMIGEDVEKCIHCQAQRGLEYKVPRGL